ncbi:MAG: IPTL-CTERM sorting domain-containing protein [Planctomycetota bacterium]
MLSFRSATVVLLWSGVLFNLATPASGQCVLHEDAKLTAADGTAGDVFGSSVSISGDTMVVGAPRDDGDRGSAYVLVRSAGTWTQTAKLTASDGAGGDLFGDSVAVSGDTVVVGAYGDDMRQGSAYVFVKPGGGWSEMTQTAKLTASDGTAGEIFGWSVAVSGDTVVVAAYFDNIGANVAIGSVYVFVKPGSDWSDMTQTAKLTASDGSAGDVLASAVAIADGTIVVGASDDAIGPNSGQGSVYVFVKPGGGWADMTQTAKLTASDGAHNDYLGVSVAASGDTVVAGAYQDDIGANSDQGSAYVFVKPGGGWADMTETAKLTASDGAAVDYFGYWKSVAVSGDTVVVGAVLDDIGPNVQQGSAYVFVKPAGGWSDMTETAKFTASDGAAGDSFGVSVGVSGDTVVVGEAGADIGPNANQGSAYVFDLSGPDCNANGIPDECDTDTDGDSIPDDCDQCPFDPTNTMVDGKCIPTLSEWGMMAMAALVLSAGGVVIARRQRALGSRQ